MQISSRLSCGLTCIFSNGGMGINLVDGANEDIQAPVINTTTQGSVTISGTTCSNCRAEVFENSTDDGEGETYIGTTIADSDGDFNLTVGSLGSLYLTATATDTQSTSEFSEVFNSTVRFLFLPLVLR